MSPLIRKEVKKLHGYTLASYGNQTKLNQNESAYDLPLAIKKKALARLEALAWNRYPTPFCAPLCQKIADYEDCDKEAVLVSGGSNILIQAILLASSIEGKVLTVTPSFSLYDIEAALLGNRLISVPLEKEDFAFPKEKFLARLKKEKPNVVFLANPNAPTGNLFSEEDLVAVLKAAKGLVVVDEAYYPFSDFTLKSRLKQFPNLILTRTFSKAFSLGGVRLGYLLADPSIVREVQKAMLPFSVGLLSQAVGEVVLEEEGFVRSIVNEVSREREIVYQGLRQFKELKVYPSHANFLLFQTKKAKALFQKLLGQGVLIRDVSGPQLPNSLRVSIGSPSENRRFLEAISHALTA
jgi:histidinol-phosphate aminotransferase